MYQGDPGRASKREEFPGAGHYRRRRTESAKRFFVFFTVPPLKTVPMASQANGL
jgi:hypothetical protein